MLDHQAARRVRQGAYAACALALALALASPARAQIDLPGLTPPAVAPATPPGPDSVTLGGDAAHRNWWTGTGLRPPLDLAWQVAASPVEAPLVVGGKVVVQTAEAVSALDAGTGVTVWSVPLTGGPADLAADGSRVYLALSSGVAALDLADGHIVWTAPGGAATGPVVADGRVIVGTATGAVTAYAASSGAVQWTVQADIAGARPAVAGSRAFVVGGCRAMAIATTTGLPIWTTASCTGDTGVRTVLAASFVWGEGAALYLASDGSALSPGPSPGTVGSGLIFGSPIRTPPTTLVAGDAGTFARRWTWTPPLPGVLPIRPAIVDGSVFQLVSAADGPYLGALDPGTGREQWSGFLPAGTSPLTPRTTTAIAAGPGILVVPVPGGLVGLRNAAPGPLGVTATLPRNVVAAGTDTVITGTVRSAGHGLVGPRAVALQADPYPFDDDYQQTGFTIAGRTGFSFTTPVTRNTRYRLAADGVFYAPTLVYAQPQISVSYKSTATALVVRATLRVDAVDGLRRRGGRVAVYRLKKRGRVATRLGSGRSAANGVARFTVRIPATLKRSDRVLTCLRGASRQGFGAPNVLDRRCGDKQIKIAKAAISANRAPPVPLSGTSAARLLRTGT